MQSYADFVRDRYGGLISVRSYEFLLGRLRLKCFYNAVFGFLSVFYVLSVYFTTVSQKNVFKRILQRYIIIGFGSGGVWRCFGTSAAIPGLLLGYPRRAMLFGSGFVRSCLSAGFHRFPVAFCS